MLRLLRRDLLYYGWSIVLTLVLCLATAPSATAQEGGLRYTLSPVGGYLFESENAVLEGTLFYGGEIGLGFGQHLQVSGEFLLRNGTQTDFADFDELVGVTEPSVDMRRYGGRLRANFGVGQFVPFLSIGTGVLEFDTEGAGSSRNIYAAPGIGLGFEPVEGVRAAVEGELLSYRYDPVNVFLGEDVDVIVDERTVYSPSLRASVELLLGGRSTDRPTPVDQAVQQQFGDGMRGIQVFVNPFYGRLRFNDALGFPKDQNFAGVNVGVDLGPFVGLRGFYGRGTPGGDVFDEFATGFENIQQFGGEFRLYLSPRDRMGVTPYVLLGGGYLDVRGGYSDDIPAGAPQPEDRFFATAGGGLSVPLVSWLALTGDVRGAFMSGQDIEDVSTPDEVYGNLMYAVGLEFSIGGGQEESSPVEAEREPVEPDTVAAEDAPAQDPAAAEDAPTQDPAAAEEFEARERELQTRIDSLQRQFDEQQRALDEQREMIEQETPLSDDSDEALVTQQEVEQLVREEVQEEVRARMQDLEADTIRVDTTRQLTEDEVERIVRRTLRDEDIASDEDTAAVAQQRDEIQRLEGEIETLQQQVDDLQEQVRQQPEAQQDETAGTQVTVEDRGDQQPFYRSMFGRPLQGVLPTFSIRGGEEPTHMLVGLRGDYRLQPDSQFRLLPEAFVGFGDGPASMGLFGNIAYGLLGGEAQRATDLPLGPYIGAGAGLFSRTGLDLEFVGHLMLGTDYMFTNGNAFFFELSTFNLLDYFRLGLGYRFRL